MPLGQSLGGNFFAKMYIVIFRKFQKSDQSAVLEIFSSYWTDPEFLKELAQELNNMACIFYVAEENSEIVGVAGLRNASTHLSTHANTDRPAELYIIASKYQNKGVGTFLGQKIIEEAEKLKFTEILCYSPETHNDSWKFYEKLGFTKQGIINDPDDGYPGMLWQKII